MSNTKSEFDRFLEEEIRRFSSVSYPVRAGLLRRLLTRRLPCSKIHPNPEDEFCKPEVGMNREIVSKYRQDILAARFHAQRDGFAEPLLVQKIRPEGYMLLNGHHRWAASVMLQVRSVPVRIVNLPQVGDIRRMILHTRNVKRVSLDLDEVVFTGERGDLSLRRDRLREGIPALLHQLQSLRYDIWLYSAQYYSMDDVRRFFRTLGIRITGAVTGMNPNRPGAAEVRKTLDPMLAEHYAQTIHIDNQSVLGIDRRAGQFREFMLKGAGVPWHREVLDCVQTFDREASKAEKLKMRVSFDLDEVLFVSPQTHKTEPPLRFPFNRMYKERLRLGTPELINQLQTYGYEVWVYTSSFRTEKYIRSLFRHYHVRFDGIVNGDRHLREVQRNNKTTLPQKLPNRYRISLHIDDESVICSMGGQYGFKAYQLDAQDDEWKEKILLRANQIRKLGKS